MSTLHDDLRNTIEATNVTFLPFTWGDTNGHGTHVAGSIQGTGARSSGLIRGGAYQSKFIAQAIMVPFLGILDPNVLQNPSALLTPVFQKGARVHSNSWGADAKGAYDAMAAAFDDFMWNNPDLLLVFAAGNSGGDGNSDGVVDEGSLGSPASAKNVLTVGASKNYVLTGGIQAKLKDTKVSDKFKAEPLASSSMSENPQGLAAFSSRGPAADGRRKPDVVAPGTNIVATRSSKIDPNGGLLWGEYDKNYLFCGGTSMATPLAAGAAAVARQFIRTQFGIGSPSAALVKASLMHTAFDMYPGQFGFGKGQEHAQPGPNNHQGHGRVDMDRLTQLDPMSSLMIDERAGVGLGEVLSYSLSTNTGIKATLVYTDAPGAANAAKALVNDIDLEITTPDGQRLALNDKINNSEALSAQGPGTYTITVRGVNIPNGKAGKQPFALLVTSN
jgi:subtilisin family serine protease